jgi:hypothetical protein
MTNEVDRLLVSAFPELRHLLDIGAGIWRLMPVGPRDNVWMVVGIRTWSDEHSDEVRAHLDKPAWAGRTVSGELVWEHTGPLADVVRALLTLPAP